ncbi:MAG: right-handed parallel beta-helix repeat-containing protein [bacterium]|nr:right-handed parallel beta-helix repeat-containing protein [bacterium]
MSTPLGNQRLASGVAGLDSGITSVATSIPLDTADWTVDSGEYPMLVKVGGELITAGGANLSGTVTLTGCTRSLNGVVKTHAEGALVDSAAPFRLGLGHAPRVAGTTPATPALPPPAPGAASVREGIGTAFVLSNSWVVDFPTAVEADDGLVVALVANSTVERTFTPPSGWTAIAGSKQTWGTIATVELFEKDTVTGAEANGSDTWTLDSDAVGVAYVVSVDDAGDLVLSGNDIDTDTTADPPEFTTGFGNVATLVLSFAAGRPDGANIDTYPAGYDHHRDEVVASSASLAIAAIRGTASSFDPGPFAFDESEDTIAFSLAVAVAAATPPSGSEPTVPTLTAPTSITTGDNIKTIIEAGSIGDHFQIEAGTHTTANGVLLKTDMHVRLADGCVLDGSGLGYAFRPATSTSDDVSITGEPGATVKPLITDYGLGTTNQAYGAIMGRTDDILGGVYDYEDVDGWFISGIDFEENSSNAILMGSNFTVYDNDFHGHSVTGVKADRVVGGLVYGNLFYWNALNPATGAGSNGAQIKFTWHNADIGRTAITPVDRAKAQLLVSTNTFEAIDRNGGPGVTLRGVWLDLDCQNFEVEQNTFDDHVNSAVIVEGCNAGLVASNTIDNSDGFGPAWDADFRAAAIVVAESTNIDVDANSLINCDWALMVRIANRTSDWLDPTGFANYAYAAGPRYWLLATTAIPADLPTPGQSNIWTDNVTFTNNVLISCGKVAINEGTDTATQTTHGAITPGNITHTGNDYDASPGIAFYDRSNTPLTESQWQALGRQ